MQAKYANGMHTRCRVKPVFVMMNRAYTTRSSPEYVDGWLGLWHALWAGDLVAAVVTQLQLLFMTPLAPLALRSCCCRNCNRACYSRSCTSLKRQSWTLFFYCG
jgi:hypothetical protein